MRTDRSIIYHIYPLGFCAVEPRNGFASEPVNRISKISGWLPHIQSLGCDTLLLGPVWESSAHGYDTADFCGWIADLAQMTIFARLPRRFMLPA